MPESSNPLPKDLWRESEPISVSLQGLTVEDAPACVSTAAHPSRVFGRLDSSAPPSLRRSASGRPQHERTFLCGEAVLRNTFAFPTLPVCHGVSCPILYSMLSIVSIINCNVSINEWVHLNGKGQIEIGDWVDIAHSVSIESADHGFSSLKDHIRFQEFTVGKIIIEDDVWIGCGTRILKGVRIGKGSTIGAGSVVTKDIPPYSIAVGNPCVVIKNRKEIKDSQV